MLRIIFLVLSLSCVNFACAENKLVTDCAISDSVITHLDAVPLSKIMSEKSGVDEDSLENTMTHQVQFDNGDSAEIEQKYCGMYNVRIIYKMKKLNKKHFQQSVQNIDYLIESLKIDYTLKASLVDVIDMTMNQKKLSIDKAFEYGLPSQVVNSKDYIEHTIAFTPVTNLKDFKAELQFYIGIGGE